EVHPELAFQGLNGGTPLTEPKRKPAGAAMRRDLLARAGLLADLAVPRGAKPDDLLDALAAFAVARAIAKG
ncbi:DUF429 domain-containing protein, partial [Stenotrophomonas maltophilia]|uniref:DUF429 domain-containing protein n=1 Tax=Stenotrophomonas maltophilia TaxID=40324 RepID=UPI0013D9B852